MVAANHHSNAECRWLAVHSEGISNMYANMIESVSHRFNECAGYALVGVVTGALLVAILINPTLP